MKKLLFIMNPIAGTRKAAKALTDILSEFCRAGYDVRIYLTQGKDDRAAISQRLEAEQLVVCCGGDGTFNETVSAVLASGKDIPVGYIPAGSTNDFAASLGIPTDPIKATRRILEGKPESYDVGRFGDRYFTYVASFGAFTKTSYTTPQSVKNALGHTAYVLSGIQELSQLRTLPVSMELDGQHLEGNYLFGAICNGTSLGGVFNLDPRQVDMRDGRFEVLLVRAPRDLGEIAECIRAVQKQVYTCNMVTFCSASRITIRTTSQIDWALDGEWASGQPEIGVENLNHAIRLIK